MSVIHHPEYFEGNLHRSNCKIVWANHLHTKRYHLHALIHGTLRLTFHQYLDWDGDEVRLHFVYRHAATIPGD